MTETAPGTMPQAQSFTGTYHYGGQQGYNPYDAYGQQPAATTQQQTQWPPLGAGGPG
eukprot:CAMPEP_0180319978 /NCGR_PEP_ID=MMETSP0988-20121125/35311_1 /TAXON_ID=697907 /ORGANISM="non described non described, Strain CCMP2293" /LENGTH=56 /DNA_ID=CAMNT_0022305641 /DNA_START=52 /DNA_END=218 /DNA_ORIENTATION=+